MPFRDQVTKLTTTLLENGRQVLACLVTRLECKLNEFRHNVVNVVSGPTQLLSCGSTATLTILWQKFIVNNRTDTWKTDVNLLNYLCVFISSKVKVTNHSEIVCWNTQINTWPFQSGVNYFLMIFFLHLTTCSAPFTDFNYKNLITKIYFGQRGTILSPCQVLLVIHCGTTPTRATWKFSTNHSTILKDSGFVCALANDHILAVSFLAATCFLGI